MRHLLALWERVQFWHWYLTKFKPIAGADGSTDGDGSDGDADEADDDGSDDAGEEAEGAAESGAEGNANDDGDSFDEARAKKELNKKNREAANLRKRLKELEPLVKKAKELEDEQKSESEKLTEARTSAEKEATSAKAEAARLRVALKKGLTEVQAKRLIGETEEELEADADELLESFKPKDNDGNESQEDGKPTTPNGGERTGATGDTEGEETDPRKLAAGLPSYS